MDIESFAIGMKYGAKSGRGGGSGGGVLVVHADDDTGVWDKTWKEISDAMISGTIVNTIWYDENGNVDSYLVGSAFIVGDEYHVYFQGNPVSSGEPNAVADSANGYPVYVGD